VKLDHSGEQDTTSDVGSMPANDRQAGLMDPIPHVEKSDDNISILGLSSDTPQQASLAETQHALPTWNRSRALNSVNEPAQHLDNSGGSAIGPLSYISDKVLDFATTIVNAVFGI